MVVAHFGLRRRPFRTAPDTESYYPATTHELALSDLERALAEGEPICLLRGETGTGKTLVARRLLEQQEDESLRRILIANSTFASPRDLLQAVLFELGRDYRGLSEQEARLAVTDDCLSHFQNGGRTLLVIDEAHHLNAGCLEELRLLGNLASNRGTAVQVVLVALPAVWDRIDREGMESLLQRLAVRPELQPLDAAESADYIIHQMRWAGAKKPEKIFDREVLGLFSRHANGIPRLLGQLAGTALQFAAENGLDRVDAEAAGEAVRVLGLETAEAEPVETLRIHPETAAEPAEPPAPAAPPKVRPTIVHIDSTDDADLPASSIPYAQMAGDFRLNGKRVVFPPIVVTDTYPPKYIYDGDEWIADPAARSAS